MPMSSMTLGRVAVWVQSVGRPRGPRNVRFLARYNRRSAPSASDLVLKKRSVALPNVSLNNYYSQLLILFNCSFITGLFLPNCIYKTIVIRDEFGLALLFWFYLRDEFNRFGFQNVIAMAWSVILAIFSFMLSGRKDPETLSSS